jgi:hypothetical protein
MNTSTAPLKLTLYGVNDEIKREVTRSIIPWGILERAIDLQETLSDIQFDDEGQPIVSDAAQFREQISELTDFVVFIFDDAVNVTEINRGASIKDMFAIYNQIFQMVAQIKNPTKALTPAQNLQKVTSGGKGKGRKR